jgi:SAM-dependent methyltransferase
MDDYLLAQHSELENRHWWFVARRIILADVLARWLPLTASRRRILDMGCGAGTMLETLAGFGDVMALDTSPEAIAYCQARYPNVALAVGRAPEALVGLDPIDVVTAFDVIEHIPDDLEAVRSIKDALAPGGLFVCTVPAYQWLWGPHDELNHHQRRYTRPQLLSLLRAAGLNVEWASYFNTLLFPGVALVRLTRRLARPSASPASDFDVSAGRVEGMLQRVFAAERHLLRWTALPFGSSIVAVARRPIGR